MRHWKYLVFSALLATSMVGCDDETDPAADAGTDVDEDTDVEEDTDTDPDPVCGDGTVDEGEDCDDGDDNSDTEPDACRTDCTLPLCGDGVIDSGETCDDGDDNSDTEPDACRTDCSAALCGDGVIDSGETCDDGDDNSDTEPDACRTDCSAALCGDGVIDSGETCDDGDDNSDTEPDACRTDCSAAICGDGVIDSDESCDDGDDNSDTEPGACRTNCALPTCGDGVIDSGEDCDDGDDNSDTEPDACRVNCTLPICGDGVIDSGETCDDGDNNSDEIPEACATDCQSINAAALAICTTESAVCDDAVLTTCEGNDIEEEATVEVFFLSEIHYDNDGADADEGVEFLFTDGYLDCVWAIQPYNGNNGQPYGGETPLTSSLGGGPWNIGSASVVGLQNGGPDGVAIVCYEEDGTTVREAAFYSYEGTFTAVGGPVDGVESIDIGVSEPGSFAVGASLQLNGTGNSYADFTWDDSEVAASFGLLNDNMVLEAPDTNLEIVGEATYCTATCSTPADDCGPVPFGYDGAWSCGGGASDQCVLTCSADEDCVNGTSCIDGICAIENAL